MDRRLGSRALASLIGTSLLGVVVVLNACSPTAGQASAGHGGQGNNGGQGNAGGDLFGGYTSSGGDIGFGGEDFGNGGGGPIGADAGCSNEVHEGERLPLDMYFLVDTSGSMNGDVQGGTKWSVVSGSLIAFMNDPANTDVATGIGYFPYVNPNAPTTCTAPTTGDSPECSNQYGNFGSCVGLPFVGCFPLGCFCSGADNCNVATYASPSVPMALPPNHQAVIADIQAHHPSGGTPTRPALEGAMQIAKQWAQANPGRTTVLVLATDGDPTGCQSNSVQDVANIAAAGLGTANNTPPIKTFVIGVGNSLGSLNAIAAAGGTDHAFVLDTGGDVAKQFTDALDTIRGQAVPCDFKVPTETSKGKVDKDRVNVTYTPRGGASTPVLRTYDGTAQSCGTDSGWYYDNPAQPTLLKMCPASCEILKGGGRVDVQLGCETHVNPPR